MPRALSSSKIASYFKAWEGSDFFLTSSEYWAILQGPHQERSSSCTGSQGREPVPSNRWQPPQRVLKKTFTAITALLQSPLLLLSQTRTLLPLQCLVGLRHIRSLHAKPYLPLHLPPPPPTSYHTQLSYKHRSMPTIYTPTHRQKLHKLWTPAQKPQHSQTHWNLTHLWILAVLFFLLFSGWDD